MSEWNAWEEEVAKTIVSSLNDTADEVKSNMDSVTALSAQADSTHTLLMDLKSKIAKEARRRSLGRRMDAVKQLKEEMDLLNHQVEMAQENLVR